MFVIKKTHDGNIDLTGMEKLNIKYAYASGETVFLVSPDASIKDKEGWQESSIEELEQAGGNVPGPVETADRKLDRLEEQNWVLMGAVADLYETVLALKGGETA